MWLSRDQTWWPSNIHLTLIHLIPREVGQAACRERPSDLPNHALLALKYKYVSSSIELPKKTTITCKGCSRILQSLGWVWLSPPGWGRPWRRPAQRRGRAGEMPYHSYIFYVYINSWTEGSMTTPEFRKPMLHRLCNSRDFQDFSYLLHRYGKTLIIFISVGI